MTDGFFIPHILQFKCLTSFLKENHRHRLSRWVWLLGYFHIGVSWEVLLSCFLRAFRLGCSLVLGMRYSLSDPASACLRGERPWAFSPGEASNRERSTLNFLKSYVSWDKCERKVVYSSVPIERWLFISSSTVVYPNQILRSVWTCPRASYYVEGVLAADDGFVLWVFTGMYVVAWVEVQPWPLYHFH